MSHGSRSGSSEEQRRLAASRIPGGYIHPKKAFTAGFLLIVWAYFGGLVGMMVFNAGPWLWGMNAFVSVIISWVLFYVGWQYDFLLFQQLENVDRPSKWSGVAIAFTGPFAAGVYWLTRPRGY